MKKPNGFTEMLKNNAWAILLLIVSWVVGFALLQQQVNALEIKISKYPSEDWFELKFKNIDERFDAIEGKDK